MDWGPSHAALHEPHLQHGMQGGRLESRVMARTRPCQEEDASLMMHGIGDWAAQWLLQAHLWFAGGIKTSPVQLNMLKVEATQG